MNTSAALSTPPEPQQATVIEFPDGLPGFESARRFFLHLGDDDAPFAILQAMDPPHPSFLVMDPKLALGTYRTVLSKIDELRLQVEEDDPLLWLAIVTVDADGGAVVNLRAPIVINSRLMLGYQVMPYQSLYPVRHPLDVHSC